MRSLSPRYIWITYRFIILIVVVVVVVISKPAKFKSQLNRKQSMLTIISTGNREEAKWPKWSSSLLLPSLIKLRNFKMELENLCQTNIYNFCWTRLRFHTYIYTKTRMYNTSKIRTPKKMQFLFTNKQKSKKKSSIYIRKWCNCKAQ